jgi:hypothetical protein
MARRQRGLADSLSLSHVVRGLDPRIHVFRSAKQDVNGRNKPGHDG